MDREVAPELPGRAPRPLRASSSGVWIVPAATTTSAAATVEPLAAGEPRLDAARAAALDEHAAHVGADDDRAPAASARGTYVIRRAAWREVGQPNAQTPEPTQPRALRRR